MTEEQRSVFEKAFAVLDAVEAEPQQKPVETFAQRYDREAQEADVYLARCVERRQQSEPPKDELQKTGMDEVEQRSRDLIMQVTGALADAVGESTGKLESEIRKLQQEIAALKSELEIMRQHKAGVVPMRERHVA